MKYNEITWDSLQNLLRDEIQALRDLLTLMTEEEQAILSERARNGQNAIRKAKKQITSLRKKRFTLTCGMIGCKEYSSQDIFFEKWLISADHDCETLPLWKQITTLTVRIEEQNIRNLSLAASPAMEPQTSKQTKTQRSVDIIDK